jgi:NAD+ kinase
MSPRCSPQRGGAAAGMLRDRLRRPLECPGVSPPRRIAILVHPTRDVGRAVDGLRRWSDERGVDVIQLDGAPETPEHAPQGRADDADLIVAVGGDGTVLAALRAAAAVGIPVLGVACGSLGALTTVPAPDVPMALDRFDSGAWMPHRIPAIAVEPDDGASTSAINDLVVVRAAGSQVSATVEVDGVLYGRFAGDGVIVSTQLGSSAYAMAAGGPVLAPGSGGWLVTPLAAHGGCLPPLVVGAESLIRLIVDGGHAGARVEIDGQPTGLQAGGFDLALRSDFATLVRIGDEEAFLTGLRRRKILIDSPRVLAREAREAAAATRLGPAP